MAQNLLHGLDVHAVLQHQRRRHMAQLVRGILRRVEPGLAQVFFHQRMDRRAADALVAGGEEEGVLIAPDDGAAHGEIAVERFLAGPLALPERASLPPLPIAHPAHSNATTPTRKALSQAPGVVPSAFGSRCLSLAFPCSPLHAIRPHERVRPAGRRAHGQ